MQRCGRRGHPTRAPSGWLRPPLTGPDRAAGFCPCLYRTWARRAGLYEPVGEILP